MNAQMSAMLEGIKLDTSLYTPDVSWDGCGWLDRDGTLVPVPGFSCHYKLARYLCEDTSEDTPYVSEDTILYAGYMHVSEYLVSERAPSERQIEVLFKMACHFPRIMEGINVGVRHPRRGVEWTL